jgi:hypothetical protein
MVIFRHEGGFSWWVIPENHHVGCTPGFEYPDCRRARNFQPHLALDRFTPAYLRLEVEALFSHSAFKQVNGFGPDSV